MSNEIDLVRTIVGETCTEREAAEILDHAKALGVDCLVSLAHRVGPEEAARRAAAWAGVASASTIPDGAVGRRRIDRLERLGEARTFRTQVDGRDVVYCAPTFEGIVALREHFLANPLARPNFCVVPHRAVASAYARAAEDGLLRRARDRLAENWPGASAYVVLGKAARTTFVVLLAVVMAVVVTAPFLQQPVVVPIVGVLLIAPALLKLLAVALREPEGAKEPPLLEDRALPVYSVLIPLRDEAQMVPQLRRAMQAIDYPREKIQVLFVVEAKSERTVAAVEAILDDARFELLRVPDSLPRTKPKALNYALPFVRGGCVVVYDAEDVPDPDQLRKAASAFAADPTLDCLQAELVVDNAAETLLSALFAGEYAGQFGLMLPLLSRWRLPMPLGGTSNHFLTRSIHRVGGWDPHNVTEDADLGVRLARMRYRSATLKSRTHEEAPLGFKAWMAQRTRWMKGWMQTLVVHNRRPLESLSDMGWIAFLGFQIYVGSMIVSALLHTVFAVAFGAALIWGGLNFPDTVVGWSNLAILVAGYSGAFAVVFVGLHRLGATPRVLAVQLLMPLYWILHTIAAARAAYELFARPYYWAKTTHGRTRLNRTIAGKHPPHPAANERVEPRFSRAFGE